VVAKAEHIDGKENPRFVVTSLTGECWAAQALYEDLYCARGDMENRIKEQVSLFADRASAETMRANQMRLYLSAMGLRSGERAAAAATENDGTGAGAGIDDPHEVAQGGAQIRVTVRKVWVSMASSYRLAGSLSAVMDRTCAAENGNFPLKSYLNSRLTPRALRSVVLRRAVRHRKCISRPREAHSARFAPTNHDCRAPCRQTAS
jgi:hypothetical protein